MSPATLLDTAPFYIVLRPFSADGVDLERGEVVDCADWRNVQPLVNVRRLSPAPHNILDVVAQCPCGRTWDGEEAAEAHSCSKRVVSEVRGSSQGQTEVPRRRGRPPKEQS